MEPAVLAIIDEASGFEDANFVGVDTWAHRILIIGNTFPCENFFKRYVHGGDQVSDSPFLKYDVKVIKVQAIESPNVQLALKEEKAGKKPSRRILVPGCMTIDEYRFRRKTYDPIKAAAGLDAEFYEGAEVRMFPQDWLSASQERARELEGEQGVLEQVSLKTSNTAVIKGRTIAMMKKYDIEPNDVLFDRGGGGKEHSDYLRYSGYQVRSVGFGESPTRADEYDFGWVDPQFKKDLKESKYAYKNKRSEMYGVLRRMLDKNRAMDGQQPFAIPSEYTELLRQLGPIPLEYDGEGRMVLPPKQKPHKEFKGVTLIDIIGNSPDESDSLVLAVFAQIFKPAELEMGVI
jgi:hypothetical protein